MGLFGKKYKDGDLVMRIEDALAEDPVLNNAAAVEVTSVDGVVTLRGRVNSERERARVEEQARQVLERNGLKYDRLVNQVSTG